MATKTEQHLETIALEVVTLSAGDIPALGSITNHLCAIETAATPDDPPDYFHLIKAIKGYLERMILGETEDAAPLEEGVTVLQTVYRCIQNKETYNGDVAAVLAKLEFEASETGVAASEETVAEPGGDGPVAAPFAAAEELSEEDLEIVSGFVVESLENLESIEIGLIDLEQDPNNMESINSIFRSFHTIKGVSGFLNLERINTLSHRAENLLDKIRDGEIDVDGQVVDVILEAVDTLKKLIEGVQSGLESGRSLDNGLSTESLIKRIASVENLANATEDKRVGEILVEKGAVTPDDLGEGLDRQKEEADKKIGQILVENKSVETREVVSALRDQKKIGQRKLDRQVKVDTHKLDNLVDLTGELVIAQSMLRQNPVVVDAEDQKLTHTLGQLNQITSSLQIMAMSMRMVPIKSTFQKMFRLVRDLSRNSGKEVLLKMSGEETEIDRNVVDELYEPMVHMIRNSVDHGIEPPEEREKAGKDKVGEIHLEAYHQGGKIIVEINDDGRGLSRERILAKAKANGLVTDESSLSDSEIYNLIFQPGFSTAETVTDVSGRGVGMDVVKTAIEKLRGRVEIVTTAGKGSSFIISLPLTLAIIEGIQVRVGHQRYIIPALAIDEAFKPRKDQYSRVVNKGEMILSRGRLIPLVRLGRIFNVAGDAVDPWDGLVVVVEHEDKQIGLLLDELLGKEEVVIKNLGAYVKNVHGIAGGAIMGDGRVGLILDMAGIWKIVNGE